VHRIGRPGRAGAEGVAISLMDEDEQKMFEAIKELIGKELPVERIEGFEPRWWQHQQEGSRPAAEHSSRATGGRPPPRPPSPQPPPPPSVRIGATELWCRQLNSLFTLCA